MANGSERQSDDTSPHVTQAIVDLFVTDPFNELPQWASIPYFIAYGPVIGELAIVGHGADELHHVGTLGYRMTQPVFDLARHLILGDEIKTLNESVLAADDDPEPGHVAAKEDPVHDVTPLQTADGPQSIDSGEYCSWEPSPDVPFSDGGASDPIDAPIHMIVPDDGGDVPPPSGDSY